MGQRSRKRRREGGATVATRPSYGERTRAKDDAVRSQLEPLAEGERPRAVTVAAITAALLAVGNLAAAPLVDERTGEQWRAAALQAGVLMIAAVGMWMGAYWAVLGFQVVLALAVVWAALSLMVAGNLYAVVLCLAILVGGGALFWFLVRGMARLKMPRRPGPREPAPK